MSTPNRSREPGALATTWLVAEREIVTRIRTRAYLITTFVLLAIVVGGGALLHFVTGSTSVQRVGFTASTAALEAPFSQIAAAAGAQVEAVAVTDVAAAEQQVRDGELDAIITGEPAAFAVTVDSTLDGSLHGTLSSLRQYAALSQAVTDLGGDPVAVSAQVTQAAQLQINSLSPPPQYDGGQILAGLLTGIVLFIAIQTSAQYVAVGIVEEKTSRVVELLLSTIRPGPLMAGKVFGIGVVALIQVAVVVGGAAGSAWAFGLLEHTTIEIGTTLGWALFWFIIGYTSYALAVAGLAALVSRQEDVGSVIAPVIWVMILPYVIGISIGINDPTNPLVVWLSYVPLAAPMLMPIRIAMDSVQPWELWMSIALSLATIPALVWFAARVYSNAVLRTGARVRLRDALRQAG